MHPQPAGRRIMKILFGALILAWTVAAAIPAAAGIVEVSTSVTVPAPATEEDVQAALRTAAREALDGVTSLEPAVMVLTAAYVSAERLYVRFLIADEAGARLLGVWNQLPEGAREPGSEPERDGSRGLRI